MDRMYEKRRPAGMDDYMEDYGWHFSKALCMEAVKAMRDRNGNEVKPRDKAQLEEMLRVNNIKIPTPKGYDLVYLDAMLRADYFGSSITTEQQLMKMIGDYMNDPDGYDGRLFAHYYADRLRMGWPIMWEDVM